MISRSFLLFSLIAIVLNVIAATDLGEVATCFASFADSESPSPKPRIPNISFDQGLIRIDNLLNDEDIENLVKLASCMSMIRKSNAPHVNEVISTVLPELTDYLNMSIISATKTANWRPLISNKDFNTAEILHRTAQDTFSPVNCWCTLLVVSPESASSDVAQVRTYPLLDLPIQGSAIILRNQDCRQYETIFKDLLLLKLELTDRQTNLQLENKFRQAPSSALQTGPIIASDAPQPALKFHINSSASVMNAIGSYHHSSNDRKSSKNQRSRGNFWMIAGFCSVISLGLNLIVFLSLPPSLKPTSNESLQSTEPRRLSKYSAGY